MVDGLQGHVDGRPADHRAIGDAPEIWTCEIGRDSGGRICTQNRRHQWSSEATRGHPKPSEVIRGHPRPSEAIRGNPRQSHLHREHALRQHRDAVRGARKAMAELELSPISERLTIHLWGGADAVVSTCMQRNLGAPHAPP